MEGDVVEETSTRRYRSGVEDEDAMGADPEAAADYNWENEWYPLYLTREVPRDAPLALQVFHKQLVLHFDGHGVLRCYEDRCPHR
jgi:phenylpropionate dioxygenase-like ring-hydroxylating dioxygenase large terminal subunit